MNEEERYWAEKEATRQAVLTERKVERTRKEHEKQLVKLKREKAKKARDEHDHEFRKHDRLRVKSMGEDVFNVRKIYTIITTDPTGRSGLKRPALDAARGHDYGFHTNWFSYLDPEAVGQIDLHRWCDYFKQQQKNKNEEGRDPGAGDQWLINFMFVLGQGVEVNATKKPLPEGVQKIPDVLFAAVKDTFWYLTNDSECYVCFATLPLVSPLDLHVVNAALPLLQSRAVHP